MAEVGRLIEDMDEIWGEGWDRDEGALGPVRRVAIVVSAENFTEGVIEFDLAPVLVLEYTHAREDMLCCENAADDEDSLSLLKGMVIVQARRILAWLSICSSLSFADFSFFLVSPPTLNMYSIVKKGKFSRKRLNEEDIT